MQDVFEKVITRERPVDFIRLAKNTVDSYPCGFSHGVQKDAIQNGWDAAVKKTRKFVEDNWEFRFELAEIKDETPALIMADSGTHGLTGSLTSESTDRLEYDLPEEERWVRWESLAFTKGTNESLGARGQGKMIFIATSKQYTLFYDSLREDGTYRFGGTKAKKTGFPVFHYDEEEGKKQIRELIGLDPLSKQGTRVIIIDPLEEVIESIKSGEFLSFIEETWWPLILKYGATISVVHGKRKSVAKVPSIFPIKDNIKETETFKRQIKERVRIKINGKTETIKHICIACDLKKEAPELHQGIAYFRGGMKIGKIDFPAQRALRDKVFGYVEFDSNLEKKLREIEAPNHYSFSGRYTLWRAIKDVIENELEVFGNKKLGLGIDRRALTNQRRNDAENTALARLREITKGWSFQNVGTGVGGGGNDTDESTEKIIAVRLSGLKFPEVDIPRVEYGDALVGFKPLFRNNTGQPAKVNFQMRVLSGDRTILLLENIDLLLESSSSWEDLKKPYRIDVNKEKFPEAGEYRLRLILTNKETSEREDQITRRFWVNSPPELRGPFDVRRFSFENAPPEFPHHGKQWYLESKGSGKYVFVYNIDHPMFLVNDESGERLSKYLTEIFTEGAMMLILKKVSVDDINKIDPKEIKPLEKDVLQRGRLSDIFAEVLGKLSVAKGRVYR